MSPMLSLPFSATMSSKLAPRGMTTDGAKSPLLAYLSLTVLSLRYLMNSKNRT